MKEDYFLFEAFLLAGAFCLTTGPERTLARRGSNFESAPLIRAAVFLWIIFFLAARSAREIALRIFFVPFFFLAILTATSKFARINLLTSSFRFELRRALLAVLVTGTIVSII